MVRSQLVSFAVGLFCLLVTTMPADAHAFMVRAEPRVGSKVKKAPTELRIWFNEPVKPALSSIIVFDRNGKQIDKKDTHLDRANRALLHVSLRSVLVPGIYKVIWRVTSVDTHVTNGDFKFQIVP
jgi:copper resistance protein C